MPPTPDIATRHEPAAANPAFLLLVAGILAGLCLTRLYSYLLFHTVAELFTVAVASGMFLLAWNARRQLDNHYILLIAIASFATSFIDLVHSLAYKGLGVLPGDANLPTQLWVAGRYLQAAGFLAAPLFIRRKLAAVPALGIYLAIALVMVVAVLQGAFPSSYVEGTGLTPFKIGSEYAVTALLVLAVVPLWRGRAAFDNGVLTLLISALAITAVAELSFTLYNDVYGVANMTGHLLRFLAFCLLCRAIIVTGLVRPYDVLFRNLALSEERYRAFVENSPEGICRIELQEPMPLSLPEDGQISKLLQEGLVAETNETFARLHGRPPFPAMKDMALQELLAAARPETTEMLGAFVRSGCRHAEAALERVSSRGELRYVETAMEGTAEFGRLMRVWLVERDVTERRRAAMERERLIGELQKALAEVKTLSGLLPICASCKKIRDDQGYWTLVETYLQQRTGVSFTHGICPSCARMLYPDVET